MARIEVQTISKEDIIERLEDITRQNFRDTRLTADYLRNILFDMVDNERDTLLYPVFARIYGTKGLLAYDPYHIQRRYHVPASSFSFIYSSIKLRLLS